MRFSWNGSEYIQTTMNGFWWMTFCGQLQLKQSQMKKICSHPSVAQLSRPILEICKKKLQSRVKNTENYDKYKYNQEKTFLEQNTWNAWIMETVPIVISVKIQIKIQIQIQPTKRSKICEMVELWKHFTFNLVSLSRQAFYGTIWGWGWVWRHHYHHRHHWRWRWRCQK